MRFGSSPQRMETKKLNMTKPSEENHPDSDSHKGAVESDRRESPNDESMAGQLGHRDQDGWLKESDSDFPEPGATPEHSGQHS
jgi:hypothetical protein